MEKNGGEQQFSSKQKDWQFDLTSEQLNYLIFRYLSEQGFTHSAFTFGYESHLAKKSVNAASFPPNLLVDLVLKGLLYKELESNAHIDNLDVHVKLGTEDLLQSDIQQLRQQVKDKIKSLSKESRQSAGNNSAADEETIKPGTKYVMSGSQPVYNLCWHPSDDMLAAGCENSTVRLWDTSCDDSGNMKGQSGTIVHPDVVSPQADKRIVSHLNWSPDGSTLAVGGLNGVISLWSDSGDPLGTLSMHSAPVFQVEFSDTGRLLLSGSLDQYAVVWSVEDLSPKYKFKHQRHVMDVSWGATDIFATCTANTGCESAQEKSGQGEVRVFQLSRTEAIQEWAGKDTHHKENVNSVKFHPNGGVLASASDDHTVKVWQVGRQDPLYTLDEHEGAVHMATWAPRRSVFPDLLASASQDDTFRLWQGAQGSCLHTYNVDKAWTVCFSPDGRYICTGTKSGLLQVYSTTNYSLIQSLSLTTGHVYDVKWHSSGNKIAACSGPDLVILADLRKNGHAMELDRNQNTDGKKT